MNQGVEHPAGDHSSGDTKDRQTLQVAAIAARETVSAVKRLGYALDRSACFTGMPLLAFANAGLPALLSDPGNPITVPVFVGLVPGKLIGVRGETHNH